MGRRLLSLNRTAWDAKRRRKLAALREELRSRQASLTSQIRKCDCRKTRTDMYADKRALFAQYWSMRRRICEELTIHSATKITKVKRKRNIKTEA